MLNTRQIIDDIILLATKKKIWLAYSGGVDSHVLLHLLATSNHPELQSIGAIHIDHQLHADSKQWAQHCADIAANLNVAFSHFEVEVKDIGKLGMEAAARKARYQTLQQQLTKNDVLLTAQHQQDQAETLLLQLLRGAGPKGLSAMARQSLLGDFELIRPLLNSSQQQILDYAKQNNLRWIDDPNNVETQHNRNYIRHTIWPNIEQRWPSAARTISRSAAHCADATQLMDQLAAHDLTALDIDNKSGALPIAQLLALAPARYRNVLRYYIELQQLPLPSTACLQRVIDEICLAKQDSSPLVSWQGVEVRRYQDQLYFMQALLQHDGTKILHCSSLEDVTFNNGDILSWHQVEQGGLSKNMIMDGLTIRFRRGGEQIQPSGHSRHKTLKHLFQQWKIPTWQRDRVPLLYYKDELIAVVGYVLAEQYVASGGEQGVLPILNADD